MTAKKVTVRHRTFGRHLRALWFVGPATRLLLASAAIAFLTGCRTVERQDQPAVEGTARPVAVMVWNHPPRPSGTVHAPHEALVVAVWSDGQIVFRGTSPDGTPHLRRGRIGGGAVDACMARLRSQGFFAFPKPTMHYMGPDAAYVKLWVRDGSRQRAFDSWHENWADNDKVVVTSAGVIALEGRPKEQFLDPPDSEYARFRRLWDKTKATLLALIPEESEPYGGDEEELVEQLRRL